MCGDPVIGVGVLLAMCGDPVLGGDVPLRGDSALGKGVLLPVHGDPAMQFTGLVVRTACS